MDPVSAGLFILAYLLAVVDGAMQDKGLYPSAPGRTGLQRYVRKHPWIVAGAISGVAGVVVGVLLKRRVCRSPRPLPERERMRTRG